MVEISLYGSGEGPGWVTAPGYSTRGGFTSDKLQRVNSGGEFESVSLRRCNPMGARSDVTGS
jgi:hypothetical protein